MKKNKLLNKILIFIIIFFIEICILPNGYSLLYEKGSWTLKSSMFTPRVGQGVVSCNGKIYVIGGYNNGFLDSVEVYDPINDSWEIKAPMPYGVAEFGICSVGNDIYVIGGCNELKKDRESIYPSNILNKVLVYNTLLDSWSYKTPMPTPRNSLALAVVDDKIYAIGGSGLLWNDCCFYFYKALDVNEVYNIKNDSWDLLPNLPTPRHHIGIAVIDNEIFVCGGNTGADLWPANNIMEIYSTNTKTWKTGRSLPKNITGFGISAVDNNIYVIGGICSPELHINDVFRYDTLNNQWYNMSSIKYARFGLGACNINGKIYAIGGATDGIRSFYTAMNFSAINEELTLPISDVKNKPNINITFPSENSIFHGFVNISGTASTINGTLKNIQIKFDSGSWININSTELWSYTWDTASCNNGNYVISVRSYNGIGYSSIETVNVTINNIRKENKNVPGFEIIIVFYALLFIFILKKIRKL